jgi:FtsP/CotA-like multicopper oxidase with cupredoxin domain
MMNHGAVDPGGGPAARRDGEPGGLTSVASLTGPRTSKPDISFTLTAAPKQIRLSSGKVVDDGMAFNGQAPGPELRVRQGDLVEVKLVNQLPRDGVTIHWHGIDLPNAEDGVPGVTQNAVPPGKSHVYRFRAEQVGTFWYHSHQNPLLHVRSGLFGAFVILPRNDPEPVDKDITVLASRWRTSVGLVQAFGTSDRLRRHRVPPGTLVRLRLINTDNDPDEARRRTFTLAGTSFRVAAIDGVDVNKPEPLRAVQLPLAAGGRYDLTFTMPDTPVRLTDTSNPEGGELFSPDGTGEAPAVPANAPVFDPLHYGAPTATPFGPASEFDRTFEQILDDGPGFFNGKADLTTSINGATFPDVPMLLVREGDLVKVTVINRSHNEHPMHLHGHHALVLSVNGQPSTGSPWWTDTLGVAPGDVVELAFRADNPGVWMDHCHNLEHAAIGMTLHLAYDNVTSPYLVGRESGNAPE